MNKIAGVFAACQFVTAFAASAGTATQVQTNSGLTWTVQDLIVGTTSTATNAGGGDPIYNAAMPKYSGVVALVMNYGAAGIGICSGSLLAGSNSILTAAHCLSSKGVQPISTTAYFYGGSNPDTFVPGNPASTAVAISFASINPNYGGANLDQNDIAVLRLAAPAPTFATGYDLYTGTDLTGLEYNMAGYGDRSNVGGGLGYVDPTYGILRQGDNRYEFSFGDPAFGGHLAGPAAAGLYLADFDSGLAGNDAACKLAAGFGLSGAKYCNTGVGALEAIGGPGDSGGPNFVNGQIASITEGGLTLGTAYGDIDGKLNGSFGEFNALVPVANQIAWIQSVVPEPSSWALMIIGFGVVGASARRTRSRSVARGERRAA